MLKMKELNLKGQRVLIREDFNVPMENGVITSDARILAAIPTIEYALKAGAKVILLSHLGRPEEGSYDENLSLAPVAKRLSELLGKRVHFEKEWLSGNTLEAHDITLCENTRFQKGEKKNDEALSKKIAALCDIFVMDAFATAHRAEASTEGVARFAPIACAGPLLAAELEALSKVMTAPARPVVAIVGGSKISTKLTLLETLGQKVDHLIVGGGIANTLLLAKGYSVGKSLCEPALMSEAKALISGNIPLPEDVVVAKEVSPTAQSKQVSVNNIGEADLILDIGDKTIENYVDILRKAKTILWNGPVGVFEMAPFEKGTRAIAKAIAESDAYSLAGGGDTVAAIEKYGVADDISYISTGGGAFLEFLEGKILPAVAILEKRDSQKNHIEVL